MDSRIKLAFSKVLQSQLRDLFGLNQAVFYSIAGKIWLLGSGLVTTFMIAKYFSPDMQGYYYTFNAVLVLQVFAELGLTTVVVTFASHEWSRIGLDEKGRISGDAGAISRLTSLGRFALRWYLVGGALVALLLSIVGLVFFDVHSSQGIGWKEPWLLLCIVTGLNLIFMPVGALLEGCNQVVNIYKFRLAQYIVSSVVAWGGIYLNLGLWIASISSATSLFVMAILVVVRYRVFVSTFFLRQPGVERLRWRENILPMQWRIGLSWIGGYFTFALFTPVLFHYHGAVVAGQMGMTWAFVNALMTLASAWVAPKAPAIGILVAQQKYAELDKLFWRLTFTVVSLAILGAIGILSLTLLLHYVDSPFASRLLSPSATACLLLASVLYSVGLPMSAYLRGHKKEPLMVLSIAGGVCTGVLVIGLGKYYAATGVALGYLFVTVVTTPLVAYIWHQRRKEWHGH